MLGEAQLYIHARTAALVILYFQGPRTRRQRGSRDRGIARIWAYTKVPTLYRSSYSSKEIPSLQQFDWHCVLQFWWILPWSFGICKSNQCSL